IPADGIVAGTAPTGPDITPLPTISAKIIAGLAKLDKASVILNVDGAPVASTFTQDGSTSTVTYTPAAAYALASKHSVELHYPLADGSTGTNAWYFTVVKQVN